MLVDKSHQLKEKGVRIDHFKKRTICVVHKHMWVEDKWTENMPSKD